jgi:eukaryotic-like serine/threonine-protein kinase
MRKMKRRMLFSFYSSGLFIVLLLSQSGRSYSVNSLSSSAHLGQSAQSREVAQVSPPLSSEGTMPGITLQWTRVYPFKSTVEPKIVIWKSTKLFSFRRTQSFSGQMGTLDYFGWFQTGHGYTNPFIADEVIYFSFFATDGYFFALDAKTGKEKKTLKLKNTVVSPLAVAGNYVFMGTSDGNFRALDSKTGEVKWQVGRKDYRFDVTYPVVADGILLFGGVQKIMHENTRPDGTLHAFDAMTGQQIWMVKLKGAATFPAVADATVYFADEDNLLFAIDIKTGKEKWRFKAGGNIRSHAISGEQIYFSDADGKLYSANKNTGQLIWKATKISKVGSALAVDKGIIYYGGRDNLLYAVEAKSGEEKWRFKAGGFCSAPVIAGEVVYFVSADKFLYAVENATGQEKWKYKSQNPLSLSPIITDSTIFLLDDDGFMYALR